MEAHPEPPQEVILDVDATDDPLHGKQEGRYFHGYYKRYCYLPLYVSVGIIFCVRGCARRIEARPTGWWRSWLEL